MEKADKIILSDRIFDGTSKQLRKGMIAIGNGKILFLGDEKYISKYQQETTEILDYKDFFVMPGFIDAHTHVQITRMHQTGVNLSGSKSKEEACKRIADYAATHKNQTSIFAYGWLNNQWENPALPSKELLDQVDCNRPIIATHQEEHGMWLNTKAMEMAGITGHSFGVAEGYLKVDEDGYPTGCLFEGAMIPVIEKFYQYPVEELTTMLQDFSKEALRVGITGVTDMRPYFGIDLGNDHAYEEYGKTMKGIRYFVTLKLTEDAPKKVLELNQRWETIDSVYCVGVKDFMDGICSAYTAALVEPYSDNPDLVGETFYNQRELDDRINKMHSAGISCHIHCCGDRAVRNTLNAIEKAIQKNGYQNQRHCIEHIEALTDEDLPRFEKLGVTASMQPLHLVLMSETDEGESYRDFFGEHRDHTLFRWKDLINTGANLAFGTDAPIVDLNPLLGIAMAMTRVHADGLPIGGWGKSQKLTAYEALKAYTYGAAYSVGLENKIGQIKPGYFADITVLDRDLFNAEPEEIKAAKNLFTMVNGEILYRRT